VLDWGGVLTTDVRDALALWARSEQIPFDVVGKAFAQWLGPAEAEREMINPVHLLERGELAVAEFEHFLADALAPADGHRLAPAGLLTRMFAYFTQAPAMTALVWRAREAGLSTALLSNSWGNSYPAETWEGMFDAVVISGEVGMRKPEPQIYTYTCDKLGLAPEETVFVDDLEPNVTAAADVGMIAIRHTSYKQTVDQLSTLFGRDLSGHPPVG
jgi:putative hydrolase of the HAD superfamily